MNEINCSRKLDNIEVAVRMRPLNHQEVSARQDIAFEIKKGDRDSSFLSGNGELRRSLEVLGEGQGRIIQLKNKFKFGLTNWSNEKDNGKKKRSKSQMHFKTAVKTKKVDLSRDISGTMEDDEEEALLMNNQSAITIDQAASSKQSLYKGDFATNIGKGMVRAASACHRGSFSAFKQPSQIKLRHASNVTPEIKKGYASRNSTPEQQQEVSEFQIVPSLGEGLLKATQNFKVQVEFNGGSGWQSNRASNADMFKSQRRQPADGSILSIKQRNSQSHLPTTNRRFSSRLPSLTARKLPPQAGGSLAMQQGHQAERVVRTARKRTSSQLPGSVMKPTRAAAQPKALGGHGQPQVLRQKQQSKFAFDLVYGERDSNRDVYEQTVRRVVLSGLEGINGTVFVYGQTGTGKTYTMMGSQRLIDSQINRDDHKGQLYNAYENSGVLILAMQDLFGRIDEMSAASADARQFEIRLSYLEIYNELVYDLMVDAGKVVGERALPIHQANSKHFVVKGANEIAVQNIEQVLQLIQLGESNRHYAETQLNHCSSRSHTLFRLSLTQYQRQADSDDTFLAMQSYLNFVDLAGSEKITNYFGSTDAASAKKRNLGVREASAEKQAQNQRLKEGLSINKSLFYLTQVIHMLSQRSQKHVPFRNSSLTKILKSSLIGNARTTIIVCLTPAHSQIEQSLSSLSFGQKAMRVQQETHVEIKNIKHSAIRARNGHLYSGAGGDRSQAEVREAMQDYEDKIEELQRQLTSQQVGAQSVPNARLEEVQAERDRLARALELLGDRSVYTKMMYTQQSKGVQVMSLRVAGDVILQCRRQVIESVEQLLEERDARQAEQQRISYSCHATANHLANELRLAKEENVELKEECDRLDLAYQEIMAEFSKMQSIQAEIAQITSTHKNEATAFKLDDAELPPNLESLTDRELAAIDRRLKLKLARIRDEKARRRRQQMRSECHLQSTLRSQRSGRSSRTTSPVCRLNMDECWQQSSREGASMRQEALRINPVNTQRGNEPEVAQAAPMSPEVVQHRQEQLVEALKTERASSNGDDGDALLDHGETQAAAESQEDQRDEESFYDEEERREYEMKQTELKIWQQQAELFEVIKEDVLRENNPSSFDNVSQSLRYFDANSQARYTISQVQQNGQQSLLNSGMVRSLQQNSVPGSGLQSVAEVTQQADELAHVLQQRQVSQDTAPAEAPKNVSVRPKLVPQLRLGQAHSIPAIASFVNHEQFYKNMQESGRYSEKSISMPIGETPVRRVLNIQPAVFDLEGQHPSQMAATKFTIESLDASKSPAGSALAATLDKLSGCRRTELMMGQAQTQDDPRRNFQKNALMNNELMHEFEVDCHLAQNQVMPLAKKCDRIVRSSHVQVEQPRAQHKKARPSVLESVLAGHLQQRPAELTLKEQRSSKKKKCGSSPSQQDCKENNNTSVVQNVSILSLARQSKSNVSEASRDSVNQSKVLQQQRVERNGSRRPTKNLSIDLTGDDEESDVICITSVMQMTGSPGNQNRRPTKNTREPPQVVIRSFDSSAERLVEVNDDSLSDLTMVQADAHGPSATAEDKSDCFVNIQVTLDDRQQVSGAGSCVAPSEKETPSILEMARMQREEALFRRNMEQVMQISSIKPSYDSGTDTMLSSFHSRRTSQQMQSAPLSALHGRDELQKRREHNMIYKQTYEEYQHEQAQVSPPVKVSIDSNLQTAVKNEKADGEPAGTMPTQADDLGIDSAIPHTYVNANLMTSTSPVDGGELKGYQSTHTRSNSALIRSNNASQELRKRPPVLTLNNLQPDRPQSQQQYAAQTLPTQRSSVSTHRTAGLGARSTSHTRFGNMPPPPPKKNQLTYNDNCCESSMASQSLMAKLLEQRVAHIRKLIESNEFAGQTEHLTQMRELQKEYMAMMSKHHQNALLSHRSNGAKTGRRLNRATTENSDVAYRRNTSKATPLQERKKDAFMPSQQRFASQPDMTNMAARGAQKSRQALRSNTHFNNYVGDY